MLLTLTIYFYCTLWCQYHPRWFFQAHVSWCFSKFAGSKTFQSHFNGLVDGKMYRKPLIFPWRSWGFPVIFPGKTNQLTIGWPADTHVTQSRLQPRPREPWTAPSDDLWSRLRSSVTNRGRSECQAQRMNNWTLPGDYLTKNNSGKWTFLLGKFTKTNGHFQ